MRVEEYFAAREIGRLGPRSSLTKNILSECQRFTTSCLSLVLLSLSDTFVKALLTGLHAEVCPIQGASFPAAPIY